MNIQNTRFSMNNHICVDYPFAINANNFDNKAKNIYANNYLKSKKCYDM